MKRSIAIAVAVLAFAVLAIGGNWAYKKSQKLSQQNRVAELVRDTTEQLREALAPRPSAAIVARIDANLQAAKAPRDPQLAGAAEVYIVGAREIAKRRVEIERLLRQAAADRQALAGHLVRGARRNQAWFRDAMELKKRVERDHFELSITLKALDELLYTLPESQKQLAPHVAAGALLEESLRQEARKQAQEQAKRASLELEQARRLDVR
jgi:hypothetical protein